MSLLVTALLEKELVTQEQINDARSKQQGAKIPLHEVLIDMGFIKEEVVVEVAAEVFHMPICDLSAESFDPEVVKLVPYELAKRYGVFPVRIERNALVLAMSDPQDVIARDDLAVIAKKDIQPILCSKSVIKVFLEQHYHSDETVYDILKNIVDQTSLEPIKKFTSSGAVQLIEDSDAPVVRLCTLIITDAVKARASDIHVEVQESEVIVRYRVDGDLQNVMRIPAALHPFIVSRLKILSELDIAETRKPQDGRSKILVYGRKIDLRVSVIPTFFGEKVEMRLLDLQEAKIDLAKIGLSSSDSHIFQSAIRKPQGMILVTGPTGSGKTSTLYAALNYIKHETKNIVTIEDPIEYLIAGVNQMQVNPQKNVTFATGLRSILRQDPNIILVGEIRDQETAEIAFQSSLTGHLVLSTMHTNNSVSSVTRLRDLGVEAYSIASSVVLIVAQRLIKVICSDCREEYVPPQNLIADFRKHIEELRITKFFHGKGCPRCNFTGYMGRTAIFEMMAINDSIRRLIAEEVPEEQIFLAAQNNGLKPLIYSGMDKVASGMSTLDELIRVIGVREEDRIDKFSRDTGQKIKILIADDEEDILRILEARLQSFGYQVIVARDGSEALELAHRAKPDLIISDVTMPKMNGFEMLRHLRSRLETAVIPVIMLTARQDKSSELEGFAQGADDYIIKPFDSDKLLARIKMILHRR